MTNVQRPTTTRLLSLGRGVRPWAARTRTTVSRRDTIFSDDWVGLSLDSTHAGQTAYQ